MTSKPLQKSPQILAFLLLTLFVTTDATAGPVAHPDRVNTTPGAAQTVGVLWNDSGSRLWVSDVNHYSQQGGRAYVLPGGQKIHYTPKAGFSGTDVFWYAITDAHGKTNSSKVTVSVSGREHQIAKKTHQRAKRHNNYSVQWSQPGYSVQWSQPGLSFSYSKPGGVSAHFGAGWEQPHQGGAGWQQPHQGGAGPVGHPDAYDTHVSSGQTKLYVLSNDQGQGLSVSSTNPWTENGGQAWVVNDHTGSYIMYTPKPGYKGPDRLWYVVRDANGRTNSSSARISMW